MPSLPSCILWQQHDCSCVCFKWELIKFLAPYSSLLKGNNDYEVNYAKHSSFDKCFHQFLGLQVISC